MVEPRTATTEGHNIDSFSPPIARGPDTPLALLERLRQPDQPEAWDLFLRLYTDLILKWVKRQINNDADAADVTQEILLKLFLLMPGYKRGENQPFRYLLSRIVTNKCTDFYRRRAARNRAHDAAGGAKPAVDPPTPDFVVIEEAEYRLGLIHRTWEVIRPECSEPEALAFEAVYLRRRPVPELAAELRKTENAVFLAARRVLRRLRQRVSELAGLLD